MKITEIMKEGKEEEEEVEEEEGFLPEDERRGDLSPASSFASARLSLSSLSSMSSSSSPSFSLSPSRTPWDRRAIGRDIEVRVSFDWLPFTYEEWYGHPDPAATRGAMVKQGSSSANLVDHSISQTRGSSVSATAKTQSDLRIMITVVQNEEGANRNPLKLFLSKLGAGLPFDSGKYDRLLWYQDKGRHAFGEFSIAVNQANSLLEDHGQVYSGYLSNLESGPYGTFVGVYDGHGGPETACFITEHIFDHLKRFATEQNSISANVIRKAYQATEEDFFALVSRKWLSKPTLAVVGSCCLVGVICEGTLYVANLGDSRVVLGRTVNGKVLAIQLSEEHNARSEFVRQELQAMHPDDPRIVVLKHNVWWVKGIIQLSRSIGDAYLKKVEFNREPLDTRYRLEEPFKTPILSSEPSICVQSIQANDQFLIFASDGLWEHLSNQEAVDIVHNCPKRGSARRLVKAALQQAARIREVIYEDIKRIDRGVRRHYHDDITVIVVYLDTNLVFRASSSQL